MRYLLPVLLCTPFLAFNQQLEQQVLPTQGDFNTSQEISVSWTLGEAFTETVYHDGTVLTQGFQQPYFEISEIDAPESKRLDALVFPNPTAGVLNIHIPGITDSYRVELMDMHGRVLHNSVYEENESTLDLTAYSAGQYLVRITSTVQQAQAAFKIMKLQ